MNQRNTLVGAAYCRVGYVNADAVDKFDTSLVRLYHLIELHTNVGDERLIAELNSIYTQLKEVRDDLNV
jgi:hypothetical protein